MSTSRGGFKSGNLPGNDKTGFSGTPFADQLKGTRGADTIDGGAGDDVIIGYYGNDVLEGGAGSDDLSGSYGDDSLIGGSWNATDSNGTIDIGHWQLTAGGETPADGTDDVWTFQREFTQDVSGDDYVAAGNFADNGTDTIYGYDASADEIEVNALQAALNAIVAELDLLDGGEVGSKTLADVTSAHLVAGGYVAFDNGQLKIDLDGGEGGAQDVWFNVKVDASGLAGGQQTNVGDVRPVDPVWSDAAAVVLSINGLAFTFTSDPVPTFA